jgi:hypothetical protein
MGSGKLLSFSEGKIEAQIEHLHKLHPLERQPEDIDNVVPFLAGPDGGCDAKTITIATANTPTSINNDLLVHVLIIRPP